MVTNAVLNSRQDPSFSASSTLRVTSTGLLVPEPLKFRLNSVVLLPLMMKSSRAKAVL